MQILNLTENEMAYLAEAVTRAQAEHKEFRLAWDGGFKYKVGGGMWSPPLAGNME